MKLFILIILIFNGYSLFFTTLNKYLYSNLSHNIKCSNYTYINIRSELLQSCMLGYDIEKHQYYLYFILDYYIIVYIVFQKDPDGKFTIKESESSKNISEYFNVKFPIYFYSSDNNIIVLVIQAKESGKNGYLLLTFEINSSIHKKYDTTEQDIWRQTTLHKINDLGVVMKQLKPHIFNYTDDEVFNDLYQKHPYLKSFACDGCAYFTLHLINLMKVYKYPIGKIIVIISIKDIKKPPPINNFDLSNDIEMKYTYIHLAQIVQVNNKFFSLEKNAVPNFLFSIEELIYYFEHQVDSCKYPLVCFFYIAPEESYTT